MLKTVFSAFGPKYVKQGFVASPSSWCHVSDCVCKLGILATYTAHCKSVLGPSPTVLLQQPSQQLQSLVTYTMSTTLIYLGLLLLLHQGLQSHAMITHTKVQVHNLAWDSYNATPHESFLACSIHCTATHPKCLVFGWLSGTCYHGLPIFKPLQDGQVEGWSSLYMMSEEEASMKTLAGMQIADHSRWETNFYEKFYLFKGKMFWRSKVLMTSEQATEECSHFGGILLVLHDRDIFEFAIDSGLVHPGDITAIGVKLKSTTNNTVCGQADCNGRMIWADGEPVTYQPYLHCLDVEFPLQNFGFLFREIYRATDNERELCPGFNGNFWLLSDSNENYDNMRFICQFNF